MRCTTFARIVLAVVVFGASLAGALLGPNRVAADAAIVPAELLLRIEDLPDGFAVASGAGAPTLLPDGLARQAAASFRRQVRNDAATEVRQVVLVFDDRAAAEYLPRFRDLLVRHQGYGVISESDAAFRLGRLRDGERGVVAGLALGEVLVMTTVTGPTEDGFADDAASLTEQVAARIPASGERMDARGFAEAGASLGGATTGLPHLNLPRTDLSNRFPVPVANPPSPPVIDVIRSRPALPPPDPGLSALAPIHNLGGSPVTSAGLLEYTRSVGPLIDEFWARTLSQAGREYRRPGFVVVPPGEVVHTGCLNHDGEPAVADSLSYCGPDEAIYIYEPFLRDDLIAGANWRERDFVVATVLAHEWGHHIQKLLGVTDASITVINAVPEAWPLVSRQEELQADCYAGLFARYANERGWLNLGDLTEGQDAAFRAGDRHVESPGHHGTPEQRREWFTRGYIHYSLRACEGW